MKEEKEEEENVLVPFTLWSLQPLPEVKDSRKDTVDVIQYLLYSKNPHTRTCGLRTPRLKFGKKGAYI